MKNNNITIKKLKNTNFSNLYNALLTNNNINDDILYQLLKLSIIFINSEDKNIEKLGYRIILLFSIKTENYYPLYDIAINKGLYPIIHIIDRFNLIEDSFYSEVNSSLIEQLKNNNHYLSSEQVKLHTYYENNIDKSLCIVAPTSYGKSELFINEIEKLENKKICILVPTKTLLEEVKIKLSKINTINSRLIITHPDMYNKSEKSFIAVFTQERLLRLLKNEKDLYFDYVVIDEAHNLLAKDERTLTLSTSIMVLYKRNNNTKFKYLTPFIKDIKSLNLKFIENTTNEFKISEYLKSEMIYYYNYSNAGNFLYLYDQFIDQYYELAKHSMNEFDFIKDKAGKKNIVYFNKPKEIEKFAYEFAEKLNEIKSEYIDSIINNIKDYVNKDYKLLFCLKHGVIYHHGAVPDLVRYYIEELYKNCDDIKYIVCSSTLLEGVNLSADKLFVFQFKRGQRNLNSSDIKNLIGRICRFSEIFNETTNNLYLLTPKVYFVDFPKYSDSRSSMKNCIQNTLRIDKKINDKLENPLLENAKCKQKDYEKDINFISNFEDNIINIDNPKLLRTKFGKSCIQNGITEINVFEQENEMQQKIDILIANNFVIDNCDVLFEKISDIFLIEEINNEDNNFDRLKRNKARNFYSFMLKSMIDNYSFSSLINKIVYYWKNRIRMKNDGSISEAYAYVGRWGDITRNGNRKYWIDLTSKSDNELVNLAIIKAKEEQDYINYTIIKFIETFNDFNLLDKNFYNKVKYGTSDNNYILMIQNGYSISLANLLLKHYCNYISIDEENKNISIDSSVIQLMKNDNVNGLLIFELERLL